MKRIIETFNKIIFVVFILFMIIGFNDCTVGVFEGGSDLSALNIKYYNTNEKSELGKPGSYKIAFALCGDQFSTYMLWFRQDNDGYWSTKKAGLAPTQYDDNGNRILDPEYCFIDGYQEFVGFYSVNPWGNLYYE